MRFLFHQLAELCCWFLQTETQMHYLKPAEHIQIVTVPFERHFSVLSTSYRWTKCSVQYQNKQIHAGNHGIAYTPTSRNTFTAQYNYEHRIITLTSR